MRILQIGSENWREDLELAENLEWFYSPTCRLKQFLESLTRDEQKPNLTLGGFPTFDAILLTERISEKKLAVLVDTIEPYTLFEDEGIGNQPEFRDGFYRQKMLRPLPWSGSRQRKIDLLLLNLFEEQYGSKLQVSDIDVNPNFRGQVTYTGNVGVEFSGEFGDDFEPVMTYRYNLSSSPKAIELWIEYIISGQLGVKLQLDAYGRGSIGDIVRTITLDEQQLTEPYILEPNEQIGFYSVTLLAKGNGKLTLGSCHWRYSRMGLGQFLLGGQRHSDSQRQEIITYFNPGDMKPPLNIYFSGYRPAEGFEGFNMLKNLGAPFMLIGDPRLEGGCFYLGTKELEDSIRQAIQQSLDYLGFEGEQLILSGLSMGSFGALYYATDFAPHSVIVGKPFTNIGDTVSAMKLRRPDEFETSGDMIWNIVGGADRVAKEALNQKFWNKFSSKSLNTTHFSVGFMEQDDYDVKATARLIDYFSQTETSLVTKGYEGRHNDNSPAIIRWFLKQYHQTLSNDFGRTFE